MRCDLHVHTRHSVMCTIPVLRAVCRESYNHPLAVYEKLHPHAMRSVGCAWTVVPHARSKQEYLHGLRRGLGKVRGETGSYYKLTREVLAIARGMVRQNPWTLPLAPLAVGVPLVTLGNYVKEN